jgi:hypothetical protein
MLFPVQSAPRWNQFGNHTLSFLLAQLIVERKNGFESRHIFGTIDERFGAWSSWNEGRNRFFDICPPVLAAKLPKHPLSDDIGGHHHSGLGHIICISIVGGTEQTGQVQQETLLSFASGHTAYQEIKLGDEGDSEYPRERQTME